MIFSWQIGSKGTGEESYTLRIPMKVPPGVAVGISSGESPLRIGGRPAAIINTDSSHALEVYGYPSEQGALEDLPRVGAGLVWATLRHRIALSFTLQAAPVRYHDPPQNFVPSSMTNYFWEKGWRELDGYYSGDQAVVKPEHKKLYAETFGRPRVVPVTSDQDIADGVSEAMRLPQPEEVLDDEKLRLAINIYSSSFFEASEEARFLRIMTVLEALNPSRRAAEPVREIVDTFKAKTKELRDDLDAKDLSSGYEDLNILIQRLGDLKKESIGKGIRSLVKETLESDAEVDDPETVAKEVQRIYGWRSDLVHDGWVEEDKVKSGISRLTEVVPRVLSVLFVRAAGGD